MTRDKARGVFSAVLLLTFVSGALLSYALVSDMKLDDFMFGRTDKKAHNTGTLVI